MTGPQHDPVDPQLARILVVDDEPANLKLLGMILRGAGYQNIALVQDPREVLGEYQRARPSLVLLDLNMPHLDGFGVLAQLQALGDPLAPPVIVLTAQSGEEVLLRALQGGAGDFLSKPFNRRELLARVHNVLMGHLAQRMLHDQKQTLEERVQARTHELRETQLDVVRRLGRAAEFRDNETGQHVLRMSHVSTLIARDAGWSEERCALMLAASPMHDVGKIGISDTILLKPGVLTPAEREVMQTHAAIGAEILSGSPTELLMLAREIALGHHEKWDGSGYPQGLAGEAIPESARIVAIADVFDALTADRPYKRAWPVPDALAWMQAQSGKHFDPRLLALFMNRVPEVLALKARFADVGEDAAAPTDAPTPPCAPAQPPATTPVAATPATA